MSASTIAKLYNEVCADYEAVRNNVFNVKYKDTAFWKTLGDVKGKAVLDLACGGGYFTRKIKRKGAIQVIEVEFSKGMIAISCTRKQCQFRH